MQRGELKRMVHNVAPTRNEAWRRFRTCDRKKVYPDMEAGWRTVRYIKANGNDLFPDFELRPYVCEFCAKIHVGHSNTPKSSEVRMRQQHTRTLPATSSSMTIIGSGRLEPVLT